MFNILKGWFDNLVATHSDGLFLPLCVTKFKLVSKDKDKDTILLKKLRFDLFIASTLENINQKCDFWMQMAENKHFHKDLI